MLTNRARGCHSSFRATAFDEPHPERRPMTALRPALGRTDAKQAAVDLLVIGDLSVDLVMSGDVRPAFGQAEQLVESASLALGGSGAIMACSAARLGLNVALVAAVGDDALGRFAVAELERLGVGAKHVVVREECSTGVSCHLSTDRDRAMLTHPGAISTLRMADLPLEALDDVRHVHLASPFLLDGLRSELRDVLDAVRERGATTSLDPNWDPRGRWDLRDLLPRLDLVLPNAAEARRLTGVDDVERAASLLAAEGPAVVVKLGESGALAHDGERAVRAPAPAVDVVNTTGAGDTFDAGYLVAALAGADQGRRLEMAVAAGALSLRGYGGTAGQPDLAELNAFLDGSRAIAVVAEPMPAGAAGPQSPWMAEELASQPDMWARVIDLPADEYAKLPRHGERVLAVGAGSSRYVLESWAAQRERAGSPTRVAIASELDAELAGVYEYDVVVALSRSGTSTDTLRAIRAIPAGIRTVAICGVPGSPIAEACEDVVALDFADERSVVQTRFATSALALLRHHAGDDLGPVIDAGREALSAPLPLATGRAPRIVFLGTGPSLGLAHEASLKCRESAKLSAEAYAVGEYLHGPIALADGETLVWSLAPVPAALATAIAATGARLHVASRDPLAELVAVHRAALAEARHRGLDADAPDHLQRSVIIDG
jgi:sugar/nucleoside kinase (ribokinase family)/fructoselysine-6-P-deglycase FrlB-like protein